MASLQAAVDDPGLQAEFLDLSRQVHQAGGAKVPLHLGVFARTAERLMSGVEIGYNSPDEEVTAFLRRNVYGFSAAKTKHQANELSRLLLTETGGIKPWPEFRREALAVHQVYNVQWLGVEYEHAVASAQMAARWKEFEPDDLVSYETVGDDRVRPEHKAWDDITRPASDPWWDTHYPPNGWLCRCTAVAQPGGKATPAAVLPALPEPDGMFRHNVGKTGVIYPEEHNYFAELPDDDLRVVREAGDLRPLSQLLRRPRSLTPVRTDGTVTAQRAIDRAHLLPEPEQPLPPIKFANLGRSNGEFQFPDGEVPRIVISDRLSTPADIALATIHEVGHYIDYAYLDPVGKLTRFKLDGDLFAVLQAIEETPYWRKLELMQYDESLSGYDLIHVQYLLRKEELWARAYAQYIAEQSGDDLVLEELKRRTRLSIPTQWSEEDFAPVRNAIRALFVYKQWIL